MDTANDLSFNDQVFAYCMNQGMDVPPMEKWDVQQPTQEMIDMFSEKYPTRE